MDGNVLASVLTEVQKKIEGLWAEYFPAEPGPERDKLKQRWDRLVDASFTLQEEWSDVLDEVLDSDFENA